MLIRGASGGLGIMAVELAARGGADVVAVTTSSAERGERLRERGATVVLDRAGEGDDESADYDVIFDVVAGPDTPRFLTKLAPGGRMVAVGAVGGLPPAASRDRAVLGVQKVMVVWHLQRRHGHQADKRAQPRSISPQPPEASCGAPPTSSCRSSVRQTRIGCWRPARCSEWSSSRPEPSMERRENNSRAAPWPVFLLVVPHKIDYRA